MRASTISLTKIFEHDCQLSNFTRMSKELAGTYGTVLFLNMQVIEFLEALKIYIWTG